MMDPVVGPFTEMLKKIQLHEPAIPYVSNVTARWITAAEATDPNYWAAHVRQTVRFSDGAGELLKEPQNVLLEVGSGQTLGTFARQHTARTTGQAVLFIVASASKEQASEECALLDMPWGGFGWRASPWTGRGFYDREKRARVSLPACPFERKRFWARTRRTDYSSRCPSIRLRSTSGAAGRGAKRCGNRRGKNPIAKKAHLLAALGDLFQELSGLQDIPPTASFLGLGFDSLFLAQASQAIQARFGVNVTFSPTARGSACVEELAGHLERALSTNAGDLQDAWKVGGACHVNQPGKADWSRRGAVASNESSGETVSTSGGQGWGQLLISPIVFGSFFSGLRFCILGFLLRLGFGPQPWL